MWVIFLILVIWSNYRQRLGINSTLSLLDNNCRMYVKGWGLKNNLYSTTCFLIILWPPLFLSTCNKSSKIICGSYALYIGHDLTKKITPITRHTESAALYFICIWHLLGWIVVLTPLNNDHFQAAARFDKDTHYWGGTLSSQVIFFGDEFWCIYW